MKKIVVLLIMAVSMLPVFGTVKIYAQNCLQAPAE